MEVCLCHHKEVKSLYFNIQTLNFNLGVVEKNYLHMYISIAK